MRADPTDARTYKFKSPLGHQQNDTNPQVRDLRVLSCEARAALWSLIGHVTPFGVGRPSPPGGKFGTLWHPVGHDVPVRRDPGERRWRMVAGRAKSSGRLLADDDCVSAVAFGPNGSGKTTSLIVPNVLDGAGPVVLTTAKAQDLEPVCRARANCGPVWVIAPGGAPGHETVGWSALAGAVDPEAAGQRKPVVVEADVRAGVARVPVAEVSSVSCPLAAHHRVEPALTHDGCTDPRTIDGPSTDPSADGTPEGLTSSKARHSPSGGSCHHLSGSRWWRTAQRAVSRPTARSGPRWTPRP